MEEMVRMGVDVLQGFHIARPMPPGQLLTWIRDHRTAALVD